MHKSALLLIVVVGVAAGVIVTLRRDLQLERTRTDALAERVAVLEPVERLGSSLTIERNTDTQEAPSATPDLAVERASDRPPPTDALEQSHEKPRTEYRGSPQARRQVQRLQSALANGTPLQDYQIQALITAIDQVNSEIESEKTKTSSHASTSTVDWNAESRRRLVQAAADILFESQFEKFTEIHNRDGEAR